MMHLVHTFSMSQPLLSLSRPSAFAFRYRCRAVLPSALLSGHCLFLLMGLINLSNLLTNLSYWTGDTARPVRRRRRRRRRWREARRGRLARGAAGDSLDRYGVSMRALARLDDC